MNKWPDVDMIPIEDSITAEQRSQLKLALAGRVGCLTGGPGSGKTFVISRLISLLPRGQVALAAPTGRAAVRMMESLRNYGYRLQASTVHTMLVPRRNGHDGSGWGFERNRNNRLNQKYFILDEWSMCTTQLFASLLSAIPEDAHVLFVGDPYQLPPVGAGRPFVDMIQGGLPHGHLTSVHRYAGRIARVCQSIHAGRTWDASPRIDLDAESPENLKHIETSSVHQQLNYLFESANKISATHGLNVIDDMQILVARNDTGQLSRKKVNAIAQNVFNKQGEKVDSKCPFRVGDKVVCLRNGYRDEYYIGKREEWVPQHYVANGELGIVTRPGDGFIGVLFDGKEQDVRFNRSTFGSEIDLGYALSVHKAQGSGFPVTLILADGESGARFVCSRAWWYTAISRAAKLCVTIGRKAVVEQDCRRVDIDQRKTLLGELLQREEEAIV